MAAKWSWDWWNRNALFTEIFDTTTGHHHDGTDSRQSATLSYVTLLAGRQLFADSTTCTVALATIAAADDVIAQVTSFATSCYVTKIAITAVTGFIATVNTDPGADASLSYVVHRST